jgi:phosphotransferase system HPr-like phosphotransfer protein
MLLKLEVLNSRGIHAEPSVLLFRRLRWPILDSVLFRNDGPYSDGSWQDGTSIVEVMGAGIPQGAVVEFLLRGADSPQMALELEYLFRVVFFKIDCTRTLEEMVNELGITSGRLLADAVALKNRSDLRHWMESAWVLGDTQLILDDLSELLSNPFTSKEGVTRLVPPGDVARFVEQIQATFQENR